MERNSFIPWKYSRWQATITGLFFAAASIGFYLKNGQKFQYSQLFFFAAGGCYIIYAWTGWYDKWRRKRGYYEDINPLLWFNLFSMAVQLLASLALISAFIIGYFPAYFAWVGTPFILAGAVMVFLEKNKSNPEKARREISYYFIGGIVIALLALAFGCGFYYLDSNHYTYLSFTLLAVLILVLGGLGLKYIPKRQK